MVGAPDGFSLYVMAGELSHVPLGGYFLLA